MRFVMVSKHYPVEGDPIFVFSQQIAEAMAGYHNVETLVISPQSITRKLIHHKKITKSVYRTELRNGNNVTIEKIHLLMLIQIMVLLSTGMV